MTPSPTLLVSPATDAGKNSNVGILIFETKQPVLELIGLPHFDHGQSCSLQATDRQGSPRKKPPKRLAPVRGFPDLKFQPLIAFLLAEHAGLCHRRQRAFRGMGRCTRRFCVRWPPSGSPDA